MYLQAGVKLTVDQGKPPDSLCLVHDQYLYRRRAADPQLIREMEKGEKLQLEVVDSSVLSVSTTLPLSRSLRSAGRADTDVQQDIDE